MLPHVLRYNAYVNRNKQKMLASAIDESDRELADIITDLVQHLGLSGKLRDSGIAYSQLDMIAEASIHGPLLTLNPRPIDSIDDVLQLLRQAW